MVRRRSVWTVTALAAALALPAAVVEAMEPAELEEVERLYIEGQDLYAEGDYVGAGDRWTELLALLPENEDNRLTRENVLLNIVQTRMDAFLRQRHDDSLPQLEQARAQLDAYQAELVVVYGEGAQWSVAVQEKSDELARVYEEAQDYEERGDDGDYPPCLSPCLQPCLNIVQPRRGCHGCGNDDDYPGIAMLGLMFVPALRRRRRREVIDGMADRLPPDVVARLRAREDDDEPV